MKFLTALPVVAALALTAPAAWAEDAPPPPDHMAMMAKHHADMCGNHYARAVGKLAELEVRLNLTANQKAPFERWKDARLKQAKAKSAECADVKPLGRDASIMDLREREISHLEKRLASLKAETPALEALVKVLNPEQQTILKRAAHDGRGKMGMMRHFGGMRGHGPMGGPMGGPGAMK
jgi:hypothetical protein